MTEKSATPDLRLLVQRLTDSKTDEIEDLMRFFAPGSVWDMSRVGSG